MIFVYTSKKHTTPSIILCQCKKHLTLGAVHNYMHNKHIGLQIWVDKCLYKNLDIERYLK